MLKWIPYVMVRIAAFFIAGILIGIYSPGFISELNAAFLLIALLLIYAIGYRLLRRSSWLSPVSGFIGLTAIFLTGYLNLLSKTEFRSADHFSHFERPIEFYLAGVSNNPENKANAQKLKRK